MRKALVVGLNGYMGNNSLSCCNSDAIEIAELLQRNGDGSINFDIFKIIDKCSVSELKEAIERTFADNDDVALFYFSGHGCVNETGAYICTTDDSGMNMAEIISIVNNSRATNKVVILDCCFAESMGTILLENDVSALAKGVTIIAASESWQPSLENEEICHGVFTNLLIEGLKGGAANINGIITPASLYSFVDQSLGAWSQRPVFKTNVSCLLDIRKVIPKVTTEQIRLLSQYFINQQDDYKLDPSFEYTNTPKEEHLVVEPYADEEHVKILKNLQLFESVGLVEPVGEKHMYWAAMHGKSCRLTALGKHYWRLAKHNRI